ncbi:MAG: M28 family peptidase [Ignavibacteriales bacterium]|nr:MAG: M28 family peptidase [Ignavibacteriaceae bacterium]MBW7874223.1 M28 family peptidase [Ignavibacteria bacterium]MCZ2142305.1 M28 family peptidase [Ignavibacteriales bacterium]OQY79571.1 MAG: hypothetical protein B6D45_00570 [Ignavibacteriales bacterium UTCHB3]MBV6445189.1 hypothetical protein [Ignavibacteriaceae bacterium]
MKTKLYLTFGVSLILLFAGCGDKKTDQPVENTKPLYELMKIDSFPKFDSLRAFAHLKKQVEFGPRVSGTESYRQTKEYLISVLSETGALVTQQNFEATVPTGETLKFTNITASFKPENDKRIMLCAHWDSRPHADQDKDEAKKKTPIPGANDGASGTAVLLELAQILGKQNPEIGVDIVLFDAEDYGESGSLEGYCLGSKYYAANFPLKFRPKFAILLDMVGDIDAVFNREPVSVQYAGDVVELLWRYAQSLGNWRFKDYRSQQIYDDHVPLNEAGIKTIDIIDADLVGGDSSNPRRGYWHTTQDDLSNISIEALYDIGRVLTGFIYSLKIN